MTSGKVKSAKFVCEKINKIRWRPLNSQISDIPSQFVTGSWDDETNKISLWTVDTQATECEDVHSLNTFGEGVDDNDPKLLCDAPFKGDVTSLEFLSNSLFVASSSEGALYLYKMHDNTQTFCTTAHWDELHHYKNECAAGCTCISVRGSDQMVTVGQDGRICVLHPEQKLPIRTYENADSCTINAVTYYSHTEIAAVNGVGQLKMWDTRKSDDEPTRILLPGGNNTLVSLHCLARHPTQPHILVTGGEDGILTIWDMRQDRFPVTLLSAHSAHMWEVKFHPSQPDYLFTCSEDGSLWLWDATEMQPTSHSTKETLLSKDGSNPGQTQTIPNQTALGASWLASDAAKHRMAITDVLGSNYSSVNSLDVLNTSLICGTDGEQVYTVNNLQIK